MKNRNHAKLPNRPGIALRGIWYLLLFLAVVSLSLFFASKLLFGAALGMLLFAVLDLWAAKKEAQKFSGIQVESSKDSFILTLKKEQHSAKIFPSEIVFTAVIRNLLTGEERSENLSLTDGKQAELSLGDSCGKYVMEGSYFRSADLLGLGAFTIRIDGFRAAAVRLPKTAKTEYEGFGTGMLDLDGSVYDEYRAGFDQSEVFEIRPYRPGDKTAQIHWKLSQKTDTLMLRQGSLPVKNALLLILEAPQGKENSGKCRRPFRARAARGGKALFSFGKPCGKRRAAPHRLSCLRCEKLNHYRNQRARKPHRACGSDSFLAALPWHFRRRAISTGERAVGVFPCAYHQR